MAEPTTNFPTVRTVTQLVRSLLADEPVGPGYPFVPLSVIAAGGIVTAMFATPPGLITDDVILISNIPNHNGTFNVGIGSGNQIVWQNAAAPNGTATVTSASSIQGYGTGKKYTDTLLMDFVNSAYRSLERALKTAGSTEFKVGQSFVTIPGLSFTEPSTQVVLDFTGLTISSDASPAPTFLTTPVAQTPSDCLMPRKLWERATGQQYDFQEMTNLTESGGLPSRPQGVRLGVWTWIGDQIVFIGAQGSVDVKIEYDRSLPPVNDGAAQLLILNCEEYMAFSIASAATLSRGGKVAASWDTAAESSKDKLINAYVRGQQFVGRRSRAFSTRRGFRSRIY